MSSQNIQASLEAMLFASGESVPVKRLAEVIDKTEAQTIKMLEELRKKYDDDQSCGIRLVRLEDSYQLSSKKEYYEAINCNSRTYCIRENRAVHWPCQRV